MELKHELEGQSIKSEAERVQVMHLLETMDHQAEAHEEERVRARGEVERLQQQVEMEAQVSSSTLSTLYIHTLVPFGTSSSQILTSS